MGTEEYFPRGKIQNAPEIKPFTKHANFLFDTNKRKSFDCEYDDNIKKPRLDEFLEDINYITIEEGMTILACIRSITTFSIEVELPGKMSGKIKITSISDPLTKILEEKVSNGFDDDNSVKLYKMFHVGQFIPTKVLLKESTEKGTKLSLSMSPSDIHRTWSYSKYRNGCIIWAAIEGRQDHGYQLNVGNDDCRIFLPYKNVSSGSSYDVGQSLWCIIKKSTIVSDVITLVVSVLDNNTKLNDDMEPFHLIPGTPVNFSVSKVVGCGLMGTFLKQQGGCIHESYLTTPLQNISDYSNGDHFKAYLLYIHPVTKHTYFTLRPTHSTAPKYEKDTILNCQIIKKMKAGVSLQLSDDALGFVSEKRLPKPGILNHNNAQRECRILDYRYMEQVYICSFDTNVIEKKNEDDDLKIGQLVNVQIVNIRVEGIAVKLGRIIGFIQNMHLADEPYNENVKKRFKVGTVIPAKIWSIRETGVHFTCKEMLLNMDTPSMSLDDVQIQKQYPGVVVKKIRKGILVVFFGDIRGMLFKYYLNKIFGNQSYDTFYEGEVVVPVVDKIENGLLCLTFNIPESQNIAPPLILGEYVSGIVTKSTSSGLNVTIPSRGTNGFIPVSHLSCNLSLTPSLLRTYKIGDQLDDLMCVRTNGPMLSLREGRRFKLRNIEVPKFSELNVGSLVRCSYLKSNETRVCVSALIAPTAMVLNLYNNELDVNHKFVYQQAISAKVRTFSREKKRIKLTARTNEVFDWSFEEAVDELEQYLYDVRRIQEHLSHVTKCYLGQQVDCEVKTVRKDYATLILQDNVEGIVMKHQCLENMKSGDKVQGIVLWVDVQRNLVIISLKDKQLSFKHDSNVKLNTSIKASVLFFNDDLAMAATENNCLIFMPNLSNNKILKIAPYIPTQNVNVTIKRLVDGMAIGIDQTFLKRFEKPNTTSLQITPEVDNKELIEDTKVSTSEDEATTSDDDSENGEDDKNVIKNLPRQIPQSKKLAPTLPGVEDYFANPTLVQSETSSDEDLPRERKSKKKKKLTAAERTEFIRQTEEKIRAKEIELADSTFEPESEEHFERLVAGNPNSSELWAKYIAYCVSNAEIHKARNIAKSALKRIDLKETEERYNIWITLLNLENSYGDKDSFNMAFEEAIRCNEDLRIYLDVIALFANSEKYAEMNEKIKKVKSKHKTNPKMWTSIARVYYKCRHLQDARNVHGSALKSVQSKADYVDLVVQFAIMEFNYGEKHHAEAMFETVLQSNPKRVDVWSTYVDQMVKKDNIDGARRVLERAVCQNIPPKKMKILFKKFKDLELKVGNEEGVQHVVDLAKQYLGNKF
ncbi:hypothetical protein RI129_005592 [Pyrocoelia pectoralis]|uniref:S1 motif domain-containing protein n=1 Tax=Pyrocoelia pectoralis TaxID=417401 RepID=A0AAN7VKM4_9COLE